MRNGKKRKIAQDAPIVAYYRVSTARQGLSGLGLEAQTAIVEAFAASVGRPILRAFIEVESGRRHENRPELEKAISYARGTWGSLVVAKLDRLARDVHFLSGLIGSGIDFIACDNPHAPTIVLHILAAIAEEESRLISVRTKAALAAYKARGGLLGSARPDGHKITPEAGVKGREAARAARGRKAEERALRVIDILLALGGREVPLNDMARRLNAGGHPSVRGGRWSASQVARAWRLLPDDRGTIERVLDETGGRSL
jgi:DNA invertase Pin-like site-specific DNA recombinase